MSDNTKPPKARAADPCRMRHAALCARHFRPDWIGAEELVYRREVDELLAMYEQARAAVQRRSRAAQRPSPLKEPDA